MKVVVCLIGDWLCRRSVHRPLKCLSSRMVWKIIPTPWMICFDLHFG